MRPIYHDPRPIDQDDILPILERLARGLVVREIERQDVLRLQGTRVKDFTIAVAKLDGFADAVHRVINAYGPGQVLEAVRTAVGEVPAHTSQGRTAWLNDRTERLTTELLFIFRDERGH